MPHIRFRNYLLVFLGSAFLAVMLLGGLLLLAAGQKVKFQYWAALGLERKITLAEAIEGRKILIVAGSNAHFGMRAQDIETALGIPTINLAIYAGMGTRYLFYEAMKLLRQGDIVILPLEYNYYGTAKALNSATVSISLGRDLDFFWSLSPLDMLRYLRRISLKRIIRGIRARFQPISEPPDGYRIADITRWGDERAPESDPASLRKLKERLTLNQSERRPVFLADSESVAILSTFLQWSRANGIHVVATFPNTINEPPYTGADFDVVATQMRAYYAQQEVPFVGSVEIARFPWELMYDTPYHLTTRGMTVRTAAFVAALCAETDLCPAATESVAGD